MLPGYVDQLRSNDFRPDALGPHDAQLSHDGQVLADLRLAFSCRRDQVLDRTWPLTQEGEEITHASQTDQCFSQLHQRIHRLLSVACSALEGGDVRICDAFVIQKALVVI
jgi:hypothetical protein